MATKLGFVMLTILILGPHKVRNMDTYLEPLIEELVFLWRAVQATDISCPIVARDKWLKEVSCG